MEPNNQQPIHHQDNVEPHQMIHQNNSLQKRKNAIIMGIFALLALVILGLGCVYLYHSIFKGKEAYSTTSLEMKEKEEDHTIEQQKEAIIASQKTYQDEYIQYNQPIMPLTPPPAMSSPPTRLKQPVVYNYNMVHFVNEEENNSYGIAKTTKYDTSKAQIDKVNPTYRLGKGKNILCTLQTKIDTSQPGMVTCIVARDVYSDNGQMILIDKGSIVVGEQNRGLMGKNKAFVAWSEIRTPNDINISIDSPAADSLGAPGISGTINKQILKKFFTGTLISIVQAGQNYAVMKAARNKNNMGNQDIHIDGSVAHVDRFIENLLENIIDQEVLTVHPGTPVNIQLIRDLDFSAVYGRL